MDKPIKNAEAEDTALARAKGVALRFLAFRARSEEEMRRRLARQFPASTVAQVNDWLRDLGCLDDAAFAQQWVKWRQRSSPRGELALRQELAARGVSRDDQEAALSGFEAAEAARRAAEKALPRLTGCAYLEFRRKLGGYLQRRGFSSGVIGRVVADCWRELAAHSLDGEINAGGDEQQPVKAKGEGVENPGDEEGPHH